jgi:hypothetical protein
MIEKVYYWVNEEGEDRLHYRSKFEGLVCLTDEFNSEEETIEALDKFLSYEEWHFVTMDYYELKCRYRKFRT